MYTTKEAAEKLGLSPDHVKLLARTGKIEAMKMGRDWMILSLDYKRQRKPKKQKGGVTHGKYKI
jgi:excisionase family DNA binding protein